MAAEQQKIRDRTGAGAAATKTKSTPSCGVSYDRVIAAPSPSPRELEGIWHGRVKEALLRYKYATARLQNARLEYAVQLPRQDGHFAVRQAQLYELLTLQEYRRVLEIYHDLLVHGKVPPADV